MPLCFYTKIDKRIFFLIYKKGIRLIPFNILESINNFADTYFIQKTLGFNNLALYNHAKLYVNKFSFLTKLFSKPIQ